MSKFFISTSHTEPNGMFEALGISRIINLVFAQIILLIFDMFASVLEVDGRLEHCSSSVDSAPPRKHSNHFVYRLLTHSSISINPDKHFKGFCSCLAQFRTKFYVRSLFTFTAFHVLWQRCKTPIHCTFSNHWHGERSELKLATWTYRVGGTFRTQWLYISPTCNQAHSFTVHFDHTL